MAGLVVRLTKETHSHPVTSLVYNNYEKLQLSIYKR